MVYKYNPLFIIKSFGVSTSPVGIQSRKFIEAISLENIQPTIAAKQADLTNTLATMYELISSKDLNINFINSFLRRVFPDITNIPDIELYTYKPLITRKINDHINRGKKQFDWIHSISYPLSNHLIGMALKKELDIPWVAHFYEPWVGNSFRKHYFRFAHKYDSYLEREVAENADIILHTNQIIIDDWIKRYGETVSQKIYLLPFNYDIKDTDLAEKFSKSIRVAKKKVLLHVGNLYLQRNLNDLISALIYLKKSVPDLAKELSIVLIGVVSRNDINNIKKNKLDNIFSVKGVLHPNKLNEYFMNCDALLVIDAPASKNFFLPSKLMEYFLYKKPIFAITPSNGITYKLLNESGHFPAENGSIKILIDYIIRLINDYDSLLNFDEKIYKYYTGDVISKTYMQIINKHFSI